MNFEQDIITIVCASGEANDYAFQALDLIGKGEYEKARACISIGREKSLVAHKLHSEYLFSTCDGKQKSQPPEVTLLATHAMDHMMNCILTLDLVERMIDVFSHYQLNDK